MCFTCPIQPGDRVLFRWRENLSPTPMIVQAIQTDIDYCIVKLNNKWYTYESVYKVDEHDLHKIPKNTSPPLEPGSDQ